MAHVLILGAGVMGSALAVPAADNGHRVTLAGTPLDGAIIEALRASLSAHPTLRAALPDGIEPVMADDVATAEEADLVVVGVASPGIGWAADQLVRLAPRCPVAIVTKGLVPQGEGVPLTYADALPDLVAARGGRLPPLVGIGGPCIARELAERRPTAVVFASQDRAACAEARDLLRTDRYAVSLSGDARGVEACAALKNFMAIGVSAMMGAFRREGEPMRNPVARAFQMAVDEMAVLAPWLGGERETAFGLAGLGDLHVTVGGGRNARLGRLLGEGTGLDAARAGPMRGETVEGVDVGRALGPARLAAARSGALPERLAMTDAILAAVAGAAFEPLAALGS